MDKDRNAQIHSLVPYGEKESMPLILHKESHIDHGITMRQMAWILERFRDRREFFIETVELPEELGYVPCALYGPIMGDNSLPDFMVYLQKRGNREYPSRVCKLDKRSTRLVTVIGGPYDGLANVLFTAFGGPKTPKEPGDPLCEDRAASKAFWSQHALSISSVTNENSIV